MDDPSLDLDPRWYALWLHEARARLLDLPDDPSALARRIAPHVVTLSRGLTRERDLSGERYLDSNELAVAYLLYYLPVNAWKSRRLLSRLFEDGMAVETALHVTDLGCGPGTQLWALIDALAAARPAGAPRLELHYRGIDHSARALEMLSSLARRLKGVPGLTPGIHLTLSLGREPLDRPSSMPDPDQHLVLAGNVLNELETDDPSPPARKVAWVRSLWSRLAPGGAMLILEPALQTTARTLEQVRDSLRELPDVQILSPCTHDAPCPLVAGNAPRGQWCHQELEWKRPPLIQAIDAVTGLSKGRMAFSHLLLRRLEAPTYPPGRYLALSPALRARGTVTVHLCGPAGFQEAMMLTRNRGVDNAAMDEVGRGDVVRLEGAITRGTGLRIEAHTRVAVEGRGEGVGASGEGDGAEPGREEGAGAGGTAGAAARSGA
jgi:ribosomal protein RSM22 (predicted rRNA methylase)